MITNANHLIYRQVIQVVNGFPCFSVNSYQNSNNIISKASD